MKAVERRICSAKTASCRPQTQASEALSGHRDADLRDLLLLSDGLRKSDLGLGELGCAVGQARMSGAKAAQAVAIHGLGELMRSSA